uniref:Uncharacterized protein n=1 Tax=Caenorhabditis japonica TaxID=281687 RepID=A0A8R1HR75_CAEJA
MARISHLSDEIRVLRINVQNVRDVQLELEKLRMQFDVIRENEMERSETNETRGYSTTDLIYDRLANISSRFEILSDGFLKNSMSMEDVTSRMSRVENKCLAVCQQHNTVGPTLPRGREQPRRRQLKKTTGDEIVFRRND